MIDIKKLYDTRFSTYERVKRTELWNILCTRFLQQFVRPGDTIVDIGAGRCEFINNIKCKKKIALDINDDVKKYADKDVQLVIAQVKDIKVHFKPGKVDAFFMSNLLEHLESKEEVFKLLNEEYEVLPKGGRILIMQPDIGLVGHAYWDFFDHKVPITYASLVEALTSIGYTVSYSRYPFMPYSTKVKWLPLWPPLLKFYLWFRPAQLLFGKQFFICAEK